MLDGDDIDRIDHRNEDGCRCQRVEEVPIRFENRKFGKSKLDLRQQLLYLKHLRRLFIFKYRLWSQLAQFLIVGGIGTLVNLLTLTLLIRAHLPLDWAVASAILVSMTGNFVLNRRFTFASWGSWWPEYLRFVTTSSVGALLNYAVTLSVLAYMPGLPPQIAALFGIVVGTGVNFLASRHLVFKAVRVAAQRGSTERST